MVDKTTVILLVLSIVLVLSMRDLMVNSASDYTPADDQNTGKQAGDFNAAEDAYENLDNQYDTDENENENENTFDFDDTDTRSENRDYDDDENDNFNEETPREQINMKKIPSLKMKGNVQTLKFRFCYSCGYRNMFEQYSTMIGERYPDLKIVGENYAPVAWKLYVVQFLSTFKIVIIALIIFAHNPFEYLNITTPNIYVWATENKLYASLMLFFVSNAIETQLITSGAFEIYLNDMQIWSKLQSERMPHEKELMQMIDMNFNFEPEKSNGFVGDGNFRM